MLAAGIKRTKRPWASTSISLTKLLARRAVDVGHHRHAGADQVLVVQVRAAERAHEEVVGQRVLLGDLPQPHAAAVVVAHRQAAGVGIGGEAVVAAVADLHDVVVEAVHQVARGDRLRHDHAAAVQARRVVDAKRLVGHAGALRLRQRHRLAVGGEAAPGRRQRRQHGAVEVLLRHVRAARARVHARDAVGTREQAVQRVEGAVLGVDHHHGIDRVDGGGVAAGRWAGTCGQQRGGGDGAQQQARILFGAWLVIGFLGYGTKPAAYRRAAPPTSRWCHHRRWFITASSGGAIERAVDPWIAAVHRGALAARRSFDDSAARRIRRPHVHAVDPAPHPRLPQRHARARRRDARDPARHVRPARAQRRRQVDR